LRELPAGLAGHEDDPIDIAAIYFGYDNKPVIKGLMKRGTAIFNEAKDKVPKIEWDLLNKIDSNKR